MSGQGASRRRLGIIIGVRKSLTPSAETDRLNAYATTFAAAPRGRPFSWQAGSLARSELPIDDDPSAWNLLLADPQRPDRKPVLVMGAARCFPDRHEPVKRFENANRSRYVSVPDLAFKGPRRVRPSFKLNLKLGLTPRPLQGGP